MAKLSDAVKRLIVQRLAWDTSPTEIAAEVKDVFGIVVTLPQIAYYNPKTKGTDLGKKLRELYEDERDRYMHEMSEIPLSHPAARVYRLSTYVAHYEAKKAYILAAGIIEQIAKERGGHYRNKNLPVAQPTSFPEVRVRRETKPGTPLELVKTAEEA